MFLPDYVLAAFKDIQIREENGQKPVVKRTEDILLSYEEEISNDGLTPFLLLSVMALVIIYFTYRDYKHESRNRILDALLFSITGVVGMLLLLLWFATDHSATANNFNILWAFAPNLLFAFLSSKNTKLSAAYLLTLLILLDIIVLLWIFQVQVFHYALIPLLIGLYVRYIYLWFYYRAKKVNDSI